MTDKTNQDLKAAYGRRFMLHVCKDGTVTYRDTATREKVFNGRALPVFSVDTTDEAERIRVRFCTLQYGSHPLMPGKPWYILHPFSREVEDLDRVRNLFAEFYRGMKERDAKRLQDETAALVSKTVKSRRAKRTKKTKTNAA